MQEETSTKENTAKVKTAKKSVGKKSKSPTKKGKRGTSKKEKTTGTLNYPKHTIEKVLRVPQAILDQNAGKECSDAECAKFLGVKYGGPLQVEISSALKYKLLERPVRGKIKPTELSKKILRPQKSDDELNGKREAVLSAPGISDVYMHYRGENLPDRKFFENTLTDNYKIPADKVSEFIEVFTESLNSAQLIERVGEKLRILNISSDPSAGTGIIDPTSEIRRLEKSVSISPSDTCFVMMPFAPPLGNYYSQLYEPAIRKAGLNPVRADNDIFGTGKIIDQIWSGISSAKVLLAELTSRNPNVYYELGLAHALKKPVVLISSNEEDVPFDLQHIRVIYYDVHDPFWGNKLIEKIAENILSAIKNPDEATLFKI